MPIVHANCFTDALRGQVSKLAYAWEKLLDLPQYEKKRLYLIASGVDIYRTQIARELRPIAFGHLRPIHIVTDQAGTSAKMQARARKLREFARSLPPGQQVTPADIDRLMPSVTPFRAVEDEDGHLILFEGVGRYNAIREALGEDAALDISVEIFRTKDPARTLRLVHDVQRANGLRPGLPGPLLDLIGPANSSHPGFCAQVWEQGLVGIFVKDPAQEVRQPMTRTTKACPRSWISIRWRPGTNALYRFRHERRLGLQWISESVVCSGVNPIGRMAFRSPTRFGDALRDAWDPKLRREG